MPYRTFTFHRPKVVVQVFANNVDILKPLWRSRDWRNHVGWKSVLRSTTGWASGDRVILNETILERWEDLQASDLLLLVDSNNYQRLPPPARVVSDLPRDLGIRPVLSVDAESSHRDHLPSFYFLSRWADVPVHYSTYGLFLNDEEVELHLAGSRGVLRAPHRGDFKVAGLRKGAPVRVIVNGRTAGTDGLYREESVYRYYDELFLHLGDFNRFEVRSWDEMSIEKVVPLTEAKVISLEKDVY